MKSAIFLMVSLNFILTLIESIGKTIIELMNFLIFDQSICLLCMSVVKVIKYIFIIFIIFLQKLIRSQPLSFDGFHK